MVPDQQLSLGLESTGDGVLRFDFINVEALVEGADVRVVVVRLQELAFDVLQCGCQFFMLGKSVCVFSIV